MMKRNRRTHSPAFKAKVALVDIRGEKTLVELARQFDVHPNQITTWRSQLLEGAAGVFGYTYLLRGVMIERPDHVWAMDIRYILTCPRTFIQQQLAHPIHVKLLGNGGPGPELEGVMYFGS